MEQTPLPPLVSDEQMEASYNLGCDEGYVYTLERSMLRDIYEASRKEDAAKIARLEGVVQELVDDLSRAYCIDKPSLDLAKSLGIEPKTTT